MSNVIHRHPVTAISLFLCLLILLGSTVFSLRRVVGYSMVPTYQPGSILVCTKGIHSNDLAPGTCVVASAVSEGEELVVIKRIVGCPGDTIEFRDGLLYRNGESVDEDKGFQNTNAPGIAASPVALGDREYFLLGDNRNDSVDSRIFGPVPIEQIQCVVLFNIF